MFGSRREKNYLEDGDGGWRMEGGDGKAGKFYEENFSLPDSPRLEMMVVIMVEMMAAFGPVMMMMRISTFSS